MKRAITWACVAGFLVAAPAAVAKKNAPYVSKLGYSIELPAGWSSVASPVVPEDIKRRAAADGVTLNSKEERFAGKAKTGEFLDNMGVQVEQPMKMTDNTLKELRKVLLPNYQRLFRDFKLRKMVRRTFGPHDAVHIVATYKMQGFNVVMNQGLILTDRGSLIITCTMDRQRMTDIQAACEQAFASVRFK